MGLRGIMEFFNTPTAALIARLIVSLFAVYGGVMLILISAQVSKTRLGKHTRRLGIACLTFALFFAAAALIDVRINFTFGFFSLLCIGGFWVWLDVFFTRRYIRLKSPGLGMEGIQRVAQNYEEVVEDMELAKSQIKKHTGGTA